MMREWTKDNTAFVMAGEGFRWDGFRGEGYKTFHPYKGNGLIARIGREIWFRLPFANDANWFSEDVVWDSPRYLVVFDALVTARYLSWLQERLPNAKIIFVYGNMVGKAKHIVPSDIPNGIDVWTYDAHDSNRYRIQLYKHPFYFPRFAKQNADKKQDIFFIGKDKGRGDDLIELEKKLNQMGITTKFVITADGRFSKKKPYYQDFMAYDQVIENVAASKAVLNVVMENQRGITLRDCEALYCNVKLITTNKYLIESGYHNRENVFILGIDNLDGLPAFIQRPIISTSQEILNRLLVESWLDEITETSAYLKDRY